MGHVARGLYRELLDEQWDKGFVPEELEKLAHICDCPLEVMEAEWPRLSPCFIRKRKGMLVSGFLESLRTETDTKRTKLSKAGARGGTFKAINYNAEVANAKQLLEDPKQVLSTSHIGEERRVEEIKEKQKPSRRQAASEPKHSSDPRHVACKERIFAAYKHKNGGADPDWDGREGRALGMLLNANPALTAETINPLLAHWARSDINHADRPSIWIPKLSSFRIGPIDRFNKPKGTSNGKGQGIIEAARSAINDIANQAISDVGNGAPSLERGRGDIEILRSEPIRFPAERPAERDRPALPYKA